MFSVPAPKGASEYKELTASLKRCPDTKLNDERPDYFFSQVFPPSALLQVSLLLVETITFTGLLTSM
jgi:hypothetical protein